MKILGLKNYHSIFKEETRNYLVENINYDINNEKITEVRAAKISKTIIAIANKYICIYDLSTGLCIHKFEGPIKSISSLTRLSKTEIASGSNLIKIWEYPNRNCKFTLEALSLNTIVHITRISNTLKNMIILL